MKLSVESANAVCSSTKAHDFFFLDRELRTTRREEINKHRDRKKEKNSTNLIVICQLLSRLDNTACKDEDLRLIVDHHNPRITGRLQRQKQQIEKRKSCENGGKAYIARMIEIASHVALASGIDDGVLVNPELRMRQRGKSSIQKSEKGTGRIGKK